MNISNEDISTITSAIAIGFTPAGVAIDVADLAKASYNLYQEKTDNNYFEVILCVIGFLPGAGDGLKNGLRIVNRKPEILFELVRFIMTHLKVYGDPEKWLNEIISDKKIRELIQKAKQEALSASNKNIDNTWVKYWVNQSIEITFNFLDSILSSLIQLLVRKVLNWKSKVPKTSAQPTNHGKSNKSPNHTNPQGTTYNNKTAKNGKGAGSGGRGLSKTDIASVLKTVEIGGVGEHMADYWVAEELGIKVVHDSGQSHTHKLQRPMTKLHIGIHDQGIDAIWQSDKKNIGRMNTKKYAIIEAKASLTMGYGKGPGSLLNDLNSQRDSTRQKNENALAQKQKRKAERIQPERKTLADQQMSDEWVTSRLQQINLKSIALAGFSRHLLYYNFAQPNVVQHFSVLATLRLENKAINPAEHAESHIPSNFWGYAKIDEVLKKRVKSANSKNGHK